MLTIVTGLAAAGDWSDRFTAWHSGHEFQCLGDANSATLAGWESYLMQAYLPMYAATGDGYWLDRFVVHADTVFGLMRDVPGSGEYWAGYRDGFLGWGTTRYDAQGRYQEYLFHDARICLPAARFARLVMSRPELQGRYGRRAKAYVAAIEKNIIAKWCRNWSAGRGTGDDLTTFGGWQSLSKNRYLAFGELLLVLADIARLDGYEKAWPDLPERFYTETADAMAARFKSGLEYRAGGDAYAWRTAGPGSDWEDLSRADIDIGFALEAFDQGRGFDREEMTCFARSLEKMKAGTPEQPGFTHLVNGTGGVDEVGSLRNWLRLDQFDKEVGNLVCRAYEANPAWTSPASAGPQMALTMAGLAEREKAVGRLGATSRGVRIAGTPAGAIKLANLELR